MCINTYQIGGVDKKIKINLYTGKKRPQTAITHWWKIIDNQITTKTRIQKKKISQKINIFCRKMCKK